MGKKNYYPIIFSVIIVFFVKFIFSFMPSFVYDMGSWLGWAHRLAESGMANFYSDADWTQYTPGYLYYLWLIGKLGLVNEMAIKIPVILADIGVGLLIWKLVLKINPKWAIAGFFLYTLNPVVIFDGSVWGQIDGLLTLPLMLSAYFLIEKRNFTASVFFWSVAFLIKPQSIAVLPALAMAVLIKRFSWKEIFTAGGVGLLTIFLVAFPFFRDNPIFGLPTWILKMGEFYSYTSVFAFNIWSWVGFWKPDNVLFAGFTLSMWGTLLLISSALFSLFVFRNKLDKKHNYYLLFAVLSLGFFVFPTKVHERYLFPMFAFLLTAALTVKSRNLIYLYIVTTIASFFNLYYPYVFFNKNYLMSQALYDFCEATYKLIGFVFLASYFALLFWEKLPKIALPFKFRWPEYVPEKLPRVTITKKTGKIILGTILIFAFVARIVSLGSPSDEYFDEVYHAFTAKVVLHNDPKAWEWWNTPPEGFAYEWTHPPLAKLGMVAGMVIFGENSFGYRVPQAILGTLAVYLVFLIAKQIFNDDLIGYMSAAIMALDGLVLVLSRIGMNDTYLLFFSLLSIYLFMKEKDLASALAFGLALSSKWSAVWALPILGLIYLRRKNIFKNPLMIIKTVIYFLILPVVVYFASYIPMFLTGHSLTIWWEMQKQMWWYHTGLDATHAYTSAWWSWPFMIRPLYLYTSDEVGGMVSRIYAAGNPLVFWFGAASVFLSFFYALLEKNKKLALVVFSYFVFFVPWAASPRIMFLYHYLPSIPFMAIATGYVLRKSPGMILPFFITATMFFVYFYPHWTGLPVPLWLDQSYYWVPNWR